MITVNIHPQELRLHQSVDGKLFWIEFMSRPSSAAIFLKPGTTLPEAEALLVQLNLFVRTFSP